MNQHILIVGKGNVECQCCSHVINTNIAPMFKWQPESPIGSYRNTVFCLACKWHTKCDACPGK